jgi:hypothetical protein
VKHLLIPPELRSLYKDAAATVWSAIAGDCPEVERYSTKAIVEIIRDANHIRTLGCQGGYRVERMKPLVAWLVDHEYDPQYRRDMERAVREII